MKKPTSLQAWADRTRNRVGYFVEGAIIEFTESVVLRMNELNVSKSELSSRLKCKPSYVTKVLRGSTNFTLVSMAKIAMKLDCDLEIKLRPKFSNATWNILNNPTPKANPLECPQFNWDAATTKRGYSAKIICHSEQISAPSHSHDGFTFSNSNY